MSREHMTWLVERLVFLIIQMIRRDRTRSVWIDEAFNVSRLYPSGAVQVDVEHPARNRKVEGSNPPRASKRQVSGLGSLALLGHSRQLAGCSHLVPPQSLGAPPGCCVGTVGIGARPARG